MNSRAYAIGSSVCALICIGIGVFEAVRPHGDPLLVLINYILAITLLFRNAKWLRDTPA